MHIVINVAAYIWNKSQRDAVRKRGSIEKAGKAGNDCDWISWLQFRR